MLYIQYATLTHACKCEYDERDKNIFSTLNKFRINSIKVVVAIISDYISIT